MEFEFRPLWRRTFLGQGGRCRLFDTGVTSNTSFLPPNIPPHRGTRRRCTRNAEKCFGTAGACGKLTCRHRPGGAVTRSPENHPQRKPLPGRSWLFDVSRRICAHLAQGLILVYGTVTGLAEPVHPALSPTNIFSPMSTPAQSIFDLSLFVLMVAAAIFMVVFSLLAYAVVKFRRRPANDGREPAQVYGSTQVELAWTVIPVLIVVVLFLATARVIHAIQDAQQPAAALEVTAIGHQFWWEFRYPALGIVTANELHIPVSDPAHPTPTFIKLLSADTDPRFWVPRLSGKTDLIPNHPNSMWVDPHET